MKIKIKRIDKTLPLPQYHTPGSAGFDLYSRETVIIPPDGFYRLPSNLIVATPAGYMLSLVSRSSLPQKKGLTMPNGIGIIDSDYQGPEDEILILVHNFTDKPVTVERGERVAQGIFVRVDQADWEEVETMEGNSRGGFGSADK